MSALSGFLNRDIQPPALNPAAGDTSRPSSLGLMMQKNNIQLSKPEPVDHSTDFAGLGVIGKVGTVVSNALKNKQIPQGLFDDAALGIGKIQGWCGVYAGKISTARNGGDYWNEKIANVNKYGSQNVTSGDKVLIPLGVTKNKDGSYDGYGHFIVALTDPDANGNFYASQSNADGRQKTTNSATPGIATYGVFNVNQLKKQYGSNWGSLPGELKINPYANGKTAIPVQQHPNDTTSETQPGGNWVAKLVAKGADAALARLPQQKEVTNDRAPSVVLNTKDPKVLAKYVLDNNISDLQSKKWWIDSPVKGAAWDLINQAQGRGDEGKRFTVDQNQQLKGGSGANVGALSVAVLKMLGSKNPEQEFLDAHEANKKLVQQQADVGKEIQNRVQTKVFDQPDNTLANNPVTRALGGSLSQVGKGIEEWSGGEDGHPRFFSGVNNIIFGTMGLVNPGMAQFNVATQLPGVHELSDAVFSGVENFNQAGLDLVGAKGEFRDFLNTALQLGEFSLAHKAVGKLTGSVKEFATNKSTRYTPEQVKLALDELTTGNKNSGVSEQLRTKMKQVVDQAAEGVTQKEFLRRSYRDGITVKEARNFTQWFNKFFEPVEKTTKVTASKTSPEFDKLVADGKKVAAGKMSPVEFVSEARELMAKGESATLRDQALDHPMALMSSPDGFKNVAPGKTALDVIADQKVALNEMQQRAAKTEVSVPANGSEAMKIQTYTASDGKVSANLTLSTDAGDVQIPFQGKYPSPREAVKAMTLEAEKIVGANSDIASEAIREKITDLKDDGFKSVADKGEIMPWEDNYTPPKPTLDTREMSKESIQKAINERVDKYVDEVLKPTGFKGVSQGSISRDIVTNEVVGRQGRISNNPEWYQKAVKDNGGRQPTMKQLREIAVDHLLNGTKDHSIGDLPADAEFKKLTQALTTAKPEKATMSGKTVGEVKGTGEKKVRGLSLSVEEKAIENGLVERMSELPEYKSVNMADQAKKAQEIIEKNPEQALKIALGQERPPEGVLPESIFVAVENAAIKNGDVATLTALARESGLTAEATTMGQRLRTLAERDPESPVGAFESIIRAREQALAKRLKQAKSGAKTIKEEKVKVKKEVKESIKKVAPTKADWSSFIESLKC